MTKALIIAEKPSVARDIVQAIGGFSPVSDLPKGVQAWESPQFVCSHALGHLLELYAPEDYDPRQKQWMMAELPIIPAGFRTKPKQQTAQILRTLKQFIARPDVVEIINACDAAREGELIFREIFEHSLSTKKITRVWLQSLTPDAIRAAISNRKPGADYSGLSNAAHGRAQADWLIGMNLSRAATLKLSRASEGGVWSIGRVQTPTLAMLVEREFQILSHNAEPYSQILATFDAGDHQYEGTWYSGTGDQQTMSDNHSDRITDAAILARVINELKAGTAATASEARKTREQKAPGLFSLTGLQRHMSSRHRWSAKKTLEVAQKCYEQHKIITYPRTESESLPSDYTAKIARIMDQLKSLPPYDQFARALDEPNWRNKDTVFNDKEVSDHFAIIPTGVFPPSLPGDEGLLFDAVIRQLLAALMPAAVIASVKRTTIACGHHFRSGPEDVIESPGWKAAAQGAETSDRAKSLHLFPLKNPSVVLLNTTTRDAQTKPPPRISEAQLLSLMEHAGRQIQDREASRALKEAGGLGTAATRADIIENLKAKDFIFDDLQPTVKGLHLIRFLKLARAETLTSPRLTADLETLLNKVERAAFTRESFIAEVAGTVRASLDAIRLFDLDRSFEHAPSLGKCPRCQSGIHERMWNYSCRSNQAGGNACGFTLPKDCDGRWLDPRTVGRLLESADAVIKVDGFPDHQKTMTTRRQLRITAGHLDILSEAGLPPPETVHHNAEKTSAKRRVTWGACPVHKGDQCLIVETKKAFICESRLRSMRELGPEGQHSGFYLPKSICGQRLKFEDINSFIAKGATRVIEGFKSKGGKVFNASITRNTSGSWAMDFRSKPIGPQ